MFKNAARKIAHNTTVPGLAGKQDLRALQDLITAEKAVLNSLQRLNADFARASDAVRVWGQGEGDDLGDILTASNAILMHFATALGDMAHHEATIREQMKAVRTREENLDELKRRRKSVLSDADAAERKLSKMNPENKNLQQQTDLLNRLRDEIRAMDADIMAEEANLGDFKRSSVRSWMGRKFGGLLECCEKGAVVGELGKLLCCEIPMDPTQPGLPRPYYAGHARTEFLVAEAARAVQEVVYSPEPDPNHRSIRQMPPELGSLPSPPQPRPMSVGSGNGLPYAPSLLPPQQQQGFGSPGSAYRGLPQVDDSGFNVSPFLPSDQPPAMPMPGSVSEFGTYSSQPSQQPSSFSAAERDKATSPRGGRFATFPVKALGPRPQPGGSNISTNPYLSSPPMNDGDRPPSLDINRPNDESFSSSIATALGRFSADGPPPAGPSAGGSGFNNAPVGLPRDSKNGDFAPQRYSPPPPIYTPSNGQGLPAGAAPSQAPTAMRHDLNHDAAGAGLGIDIEHGVSTQGQEEEDDGLAYMSPSQINGSTDSLPHANGDRRVRFGGVSDVEEELERRHEQEVQEEVPAPPSVHTSPSRVPVPRWDEDEQYNRNASSSPQGPGSPTQSDSGPREQSLTGSPVQARVPSPPTTEELTDEKSLNAAAAREVSRELDALMMSSPPQSPAQSLPPPSPLPPSPLTARPGPQYGSSPYQPRAISPLPAVDTSPQPGSQPMSPRLEGMYVRERDRSLGSPAIRTPTQDMIPPIPLSPTVSDSSDQPSRPAPNVRSPSLDTNGTSPFRTPIMGTGTPSPNPNPMYSLPSTTGSNASFQSAGVPRTISAAAFRRQQQQAQAQGMPRNMSSEGLMDTTPLNVKKRHLPSTPYPPQDLGMRSVSAPQVPPEDRPVSHYRQDDDYDYISAYTDGGDRASGYGSGRFATHTEDPEGIR